MYGLKASDLDVIREVLERFPDVVSAWVYGSRALGTQKSGSDVDIALKGKDITRNTVTRISALLNEESPLPYHFDITSYHAINKPQLKEHIDRFGMLLYETRNNGAKPQ